MSATCELAGQGKASPLLLKYSPFSPCAEDTESNQVPGQKTSPHTSLENLPGGSDWPSPRHLATSLLSPGWVGGTWQAEHPRAHALCASVQVQLGWACLQEPTD